MSYLNNEQKFNDIIFANRNKNYGAYALRSAYGNTLLKSLLLMMLASGSIAALALYLTRSQSSDATDFGGQVIRDSIYVIPFDAKPDEKTEKQKSDVTPPKNNNAKSTAGIQGTQVKDTLDVETQTTAVNGPVAAVTGSTANDGPEVPDSGGSSNGSANGTGSAPVNTITVRGNFEVDSQPEFEGGLAALRKFVGSHLKYPNWAANEGKEGVVYVKFVVDESGKVSNLSLQNNIGFGMDDEALRVVGLIPDFKTPAKIQGTPVKVYYQLPIKFKLR